MDALGEISYSVHFVVLVLGVDSLNVGHNVGIQHLDTCT